MPALPFNHKIPFKSKEKATFDFSKKKSILYFLSMASSHYCIYYITIILLINGMVQLVFFLSKIKRKSVINEQATAVKRKTQQK